VWKAQTFLDALKQFKPESYEGLMEIQKAWGTKKFKGVLEEVYPKLPKISVDYAVMEPVTREAQKAEKAGKNDARFSVCTVQMDLQWLDVGSWPSFAETVNADKQGNRAAGTGKTVQLNCRNTLSVSSEGHTVALLGVQDIIVVHTPEATLVMHASKAEELKQLHGMLDDDLR
jgi:mannose-1-phosphate guanylyltransferase